ncbi:MAG: hypothetical protein V2A63_00310 [Patescibacteria group bacterium]
MTGDKKTTEQELFELIKTTLQKDNDLISSIEKRAEKYGKFTESVDKRLKKIEDNEKFYNKPTFWIYGVLLVITIILLCIAIKSGASFTISKDGFSFDNRQQTENAKDQ